MDYEKKYKETLERANIAYKDEDRHLKATLKRIFPELCESEDEKIRKELIEYIKSKYESPNAIKCDYEKWIAWLEKQGEHASAWSEEDEKMMQYAIGSLDTNISDSNFKNIRIWLESIKNRVQSKLHWKPSDVQIEMLKDACDEHWEPDGHDPLYTLYQDLIKLREK